MSLKGAWHEATHRDEYGRVYEPDGPVVWDSQLPTPGIFENPDLDHEVDVPAVSTRRLTRPVPIGPWSVVPGSEKSL